ncbi:stalk domain-containing protein [Paenibacillus beijingensis]|uniref:stalk domain-containing protein n=1 Tax=Paenibacillus beijingensis TaxID=1126833 RepID=UPI0006973624|nr:stalk domain-containing protein [Paenibacillus beijingensis]
MKSFKWLLVFSFLVLPFAWQGEKAAAESAYHSLLLKKNSTVMVLNGVNYTSAQPATIKDGIAYAAFSSLAARYGYRISYDAAAKQSVAQNSENEIRFKVNSKAVTANGSVVLSQGASFILNGSLMVPLRTWANLTKSTLSLSGTDYKLTWQIVQPKPSAAFSVLPAKIYTGDTVTYVDQSFSPSGLQIVGEQWEGRQDVFTEPGTYTITRTVYDEKGNWSDPYSVTITVVAPNQPPVADFATDKTTYRIGEPIAYSDLSTDDGNNIVKREWAGGVSPASPPDVFFESGEKTISLTVTDGEGLSGTVAKTITVTDEVLYSQEEYNKLFTKIGDKYPVDGGSVLGIPTVSYDFQSEDAMMVRSNSPETLIQEGVAYDDQFSGKVRLMFHHLNKTGSNLKMYLLVTNDGYQTARFGYSSMGTGGPDKSEISTGKMSTIRYLNSLASNPATIWTSVKPGETKLVLPQINATIKPDLVYSGYADVVTDRTLRYRIVFVEASKDPLKAVESLSLMDRDNKHVRGSFNNATRNIDIGEMLGETPKRIVLGDNKLDPNLDGIDGMTGLLELNTGNFGVVYKMKLKLAPRTLVSLNARGGHYAGAFLINGQIVPITNISILKDNGEAAVLYRSGNYAETVDIVFTVASGSNLPITMMFQPLPELRS